MPLFQPCRLDFGKSCFNLFNLSLFLKMQLWIHINCPCNSALYCACMSVRLARRTSAGDPSFATASRGEHPHQRPSQGAAGEEISRGGERPRYTREIVFRSPSLSVIIRNYLCHYLLTWRMSVRARVQQPPTSSSTATRSTLSWPMRSDSSGDKTKPWRNSWTWGQEVSSHTFIIRKINPFSVSRAYRIVKSRC